MPGSARGAIVWRGLQSLGHSDLEAAEIEARKKAAAFLTAGGISAVHTGTLSEVLDAYAREVTPTKKPARQRDDARRAKMWLQTLGHDVDPMRLKKADLEGFERARRTGQLRVNGRKQRPVRPKTIREDLHAVFRWTASIQSGWLLERNPMRGYRPRSGAGILR